MGRRAVELVLCGLLAGPIACESASPVVPPAPALAGLLEGTPTGPLTLREVLAINLDGTQPFAAPLPWVFTDEGQNIVVVDPVLQRVSRWDSAGGREWSRELADILGTRPWLLRHATMVAGNLVLASTQPAERDRGLGRIDMVNALGRSVSHFDIDLPSEIVGAAAVRDQPGLLFSEWTDVDSTGFRQAVRILAIVKQDGSLDTLMRLPGKRLAQLRIGLATINPVLPFAPDPLHAVGDSGQVYYAEGSEYAIQVLSDRGGTPKTIRRQATRIAVTDSLLDAYFQSLQSSLAGSVSDSIIMVMIDWMRARPRLPYVAPFRSLWAGPRLIALERADVNPVPDIMEDTARIDLVGIEPDSTKVGYFYLPPRTMLRHLSASAIYAIRWEPVSSFSGVPFSEAPIKRQLVKLSLSR
jgi:hypothetical protein